MTSIVSTFKATIRQALLALALTLAISTVSSFSIPRVLPEVHAHKATSTSTPFPTPAKVPKVPLQSSLVFSSSSHPHGSNKSNKRSKRRRFVSVVKRKTKEAVNKLFPHRSRKREEDYARRIAEWEARYTKVESLREIFGETHNKFWGDLDAVTSRRLYQTLLPRALLELYKVGVKPEDLAPLAYQARLAAKLYTRERSRIPARFAAVSYDCIRQWRNYGKFQPHGMSYDQVWDKYETQILEEQIEKGEGKDSDNLTDEDVTAKICLKILERSCKTNERIDRWLIRDNNRNTPAMREQAKDLASITDQLDREVFEILQQNGPKEKDRSSAKRIKTLRMLVRAKRRLRLQDQQAKDSRQQGDGKQ